MAHTGPDVDERRRPQPARLLGELAQMLARGPRALSPGECELVAEYVAGPSECEFCCDPHSVFNATWLADDGLPVSPGPLVLPRTPRSAAASTLVGVARAQNATDLEIHDTKLVATSASATATSSVYDRYVHGLGILTPADPGDPRVLIRPGGVNSTESASLSASASVAESEYVS